MDTGNTGNLMIAATCGCGGDCSCGTSTVSAYVHPDSTTSVPVAPCCYCGQAPHGSLLCTMIREIEYYPDGSVKRVVLTR